MKAGGEEAPDQTTVPPTGALKRNRTVVPSGIPVVAGAGCQAVVRPATAAQLLATHPTEQEILLQPPPLQEFIFQGLDTLRRAAAGEICTDEEILQFVRQSEGRRTGFSAGVPLICPGELTEFVDCHNDCLLDHLTCRLDLCGGIPGFGEPCLELGTCGLAWDYCEHRCIVSEIPTNDPAP